MHIDHPQMSGPVPEELSASHCEGVHTNLLCSVYPCPNLLFRIEILVSSEERRSVDKYDTLYPFFLELLLCVISQFTSNRLNLCGGRMEVSVTFHRFTVCCFLDELGCS